MSQPMSDHRSPDNRAVATRWIARALATALLGLLGACGGSDPAVVSAPSEASATIGAAGGTLDGPDGVQLVVPAGALTQDTSLRIARSTIGAPAAPDGYSASTPAYEFTPHGLEFRLPVTIRMPFSPPASAAATDIFVANPGEDWRAMQATVTNGVAELQRLSLSYYAGWACIVPIDNTDPYICVWPRLGVPLAATPASALVINEAYNTVARSTVDGASVLHFTLNYSAAADCASAAADPRVRILRKNNHVDPVITLLDAPVALAAQSSTRVGGSISFDVPLSDADNGDAWFGLSFACTRPGHPRLTDGFTHEVHIANAPPAAVLPALSLQPADQAVTAPTAATFTAAASGSPAPGAQWQVSVDGGANWSDIVGATGVSHTTPATTVADSGTQYRVVFSNTAGSATSAAATLSVTAAPVVGLTLVANSAENTLSIFRNDASTGALAALGTTGTGAYPYAIALSPNGMFAFVTNLVGNTVSSYRIDATTGTVGSTGSSVGSVNPYGITMDPLGRFVWVANYSAHTVSAYTIDAATGQLTAAGSPVATGSFPYDVAAHPSGNFVYVANEMSNTVSAFSVNASSGQLTQIGTPVANTVYRPHALAVDPSGRFVYVAESGGGTVTAFSVDASTGALTKVGYANAGSYPDAVVVHPNGRFVYVANQDSGNISVFSINDSTGMPTAVGSPVAAGTGVTALAINRAGTHLYAANMGANTASVYSIDGSTGLLTALGAATPTGRTPQGIATSP